jgi:nicotinate phosphoribosyltransferase
MGGAEVPGERDRRGGLLTDLYELNMAAVYLRRGMSAAATFSLFVRQLPPDRGFLVAAGLADCLKFLEHFGFSPDDLDWLEANLGLDPVTLDAFAELGFTGDLWAVPEGRVVLAGEALLEVTAPSPRPSWSRRPC